MYRMHYTDPDRNDLTWRGAGVVKCSLVLITFVEVWFCIEVKLHFQMDLIPSFNVN
jgi:hypothetical protein